ncbi:unnamed protein product [Ectocarpus sp. 4 AP-2014]
MITNILYYMATGSASCDFKTANAVARAIRKQAVEVRDGHALELLKAPFAVSLFRAYAENCAPVSGFLRCYPSSSPADVGGVGGTDDLLALLALLAPAAIKAMDDNILNVHLSSLCNSLTDAVGDVVQKLDSLGREASKAGNGGGTREAAEGGGGEGGADGGADGGAREKRERDERAVYAAIRIVKEVCMWLSLFFAAREGTKAACQASSYGVLSDLKRAADDQKDQQVRAQLHDSVKLLASS